MRSIVSAALVLMTTGALAVACSSSTDDAPPGTDPTAEGGTVNPAEPGSPCANGVKDGDETDVDCGGSCPGKCAALKDCQSAADCTTDLQCTKGVCASANASDGVKDGDETDVDCGGAGAPPCADGKKCSTGTDCIDDVCKSGTCAPPSPTDGVKNGTETDTDCGGLSAPACADTKGCKVGTDCTSKICTMGACAVAGPMDGTKNEDETDVDCGGTKAPACADGKACAMGTDCTSKVCTGDVCQIPTGTDGVKNGDESDVDCGGTTTGAAKCAATKQCNVHADCTSNGCDFTKKCATEQSCTAQNGGATCGAGEGATGDCCAQAPIAGSTATVDKYMVTAGRMRAMVERLSGDVRTFAKTTTGWNDTTYSPLVSSSITESDSVLGALWFDAPNDADVATNEWSKRSCNPGSFGGHTYHTPATDGSPQIFTQAQLDPKALNCVGWHMARAFCSWDGGRLPTKAEILNIYTNNNATEFPWTSAASPAWDQSTQDSHVNHQFAYNFPGAPKYAADGQTIVDVSWFVSPPGRFPTGANQNGVMDAAGDLLQWISDAEYNFIWTGSWERHQGRNNLPTETPKGDGSFIQQSWKSDWPGEPNGYYGIGFRCVHDP